MLVWGFAVLGAEGWWWEEWCEGLDEWLFEMLKVQSLNVRLTISFCGTEEWYGGGGGRACVSCWWYDWDVDSCFRSVLCTATDEAARGR